MISKYIKKAQGAKMKTEPDNEKRRMVLRITLACIAFVYFVTMYYWDNLVIFQSAYYRLEYLFRGNLMDFLFDWSPVVPYGVLSQMLFTVWVVPVKLLSLLFRTSLEDSMGAYLWYKLHIVCMWGLCVRETKEIAVTLKMDDTRIKWIQMFLSSTLYVFLPVFHLGQVDAVYLVFKLWGLRKYIEGDYRRFVCAFLLANPVKYLSVFVYVPLILLKEKRIPYILRDIMLGLVLIPVELIVKNMTSILCWLGIIGIDQVKTPYTLAASQIRALLVNVWGAGPDNLGASVVVIAYAAICILAYCNCYQDERRGKLSVWICYSSLAVLVAFGIMKCYWIILLVPFMVLLLFMERHNTRINFILEAFAPLLTVSIYVITQSQVYGGRLTFDYLIFSASSYLMNRRQSHSTNDMIHYIKDTFQYPGEYEYAVSALAVVCLAGFMVVNFPYQKQRDEETVRVTGAEEQKLWYQWGCVRVGILMIWFILNFWCIFK